MPTEPIYVIGAGGHARVVLDALLAGGVAAARLRVADQDRSRCGTAVLGIAVVELDPGALAGAWFHVAIGDGAARARLHSALLGHGARALTVLHPRSCISAFASVGDGVFVAAAAVVGPQARLGDGVIVNHGAVIDHDCTVGAFAHIAPNATLGGGARAGERALIGAGANVLPAVAIGAGARLGAGAVAPRDIPADATATGVPATISTKGLT